jgi:hypothetical protein
MQIGIGIIIIAVIIFFITRKKQSRTFISKQKSKNDKKDLFTITTEGSKDNILQFTVNLNEEEFKKRAKDGTLFNDKNNHEITIADIAGFYGSNEYSPNKNYCVTYCDGHYENEQWKNGSLALIKEMTLLFKKEIQRPNDGYVSNDGFVICCDWQNSNELIGTFLIFDTAGEQIFAKKTSANLGTCAISDNSKFALFETHNSDTEDSNSISIVDIEQKKIIHKFQRPCSFNSAIIDTDKKLIKLKDHRGFIFEVNFTGIQTNRDAYEKQIMNKGSVHDRLSLYFEKPNEVKFKDEKYLKLLTEALNDSDASYSFGKDRIYRMIGEYYDANGDTEQTIENWNKAIQINPKIGVKRKLDNLKRKG